MDENIPQINLETEVKIKPKGRFSLRLSKKKLFSFLGVFVLIGLVIFFTVVLPLRAVYNQGLVTYKVARETYDVLKNQDIDAAKGKLKSTHAELLLTQNKYQALSWTKNLPFLGSYWRDGDHLIRAGLAGVESGQIAIEAILPYTDLLGLKGGSTFVSKSTDERIQTAVATMDKLTPKLGEFSQKLEIINREIADIDENRYPEKLNKFAPKSQIAKFKSLIKETTSLFITSKPLLEIAPGLLGEPEAKRYLVLFQNDKELRPTGGFITAYALFKIEKGKMKAEIADDIYKLDSLNPGKFPAPKPIAENLKVTKLFLRDSNFEPDFSVSMQKFEDIYKSIYGKLNYDGIITVDTHVLVEAMKILGPIPAYNTNFTVEPDKRCDGCPNVIYELEEYAGQRVGHTRENRKDILGVLLYQIMQKALGVSPGQYWGKLFQMGLQEIQEKHILVYMHDETAQKGVESFNLGGRIRDFDGDYLHVNDANLGGAKSNMFVQQSVKQEYEKQGDGSLVKTVTITYKNPAANSPGCNLERGGLCLNGPMLNWLRVYVPKGSELIDLKGSEDKAVVSEAYGKTYFEGFLTIKPQGTAQVVIKYKLPFKVEKNSKDLKLLIQKQPGTDANEYTLFVNGQEQDKFPLKTDKELKFAL